jgi:hypothetical protein
VPGYRLLLAQYLENCFDGAGGYLADDGPNEQWPIHSEDGDARRWTFEVRFRTALPISGPLEAVFIPTEVASHPSVQAQCDIWDAADIPIRFYRTPGDIDAFDSLVVAGREYIKELLGI